MKVTLSRALARSATLWDASDDSVERLGVVSAFAALASFDRVAEAGSGVLVAEVGQDGDAEGVSEPLIGPWARAPQAPLMSLFRKISDLPDGRHSQYSELRPHYLGER